MQNSKIYELSQLLLTMEKYGNRIPGKGKVDLKPNYICHYDNPSL